MKIKTACAVKSFQEEKEIVDLFGKLYRVITPMTSFQPKKSTESSELNADEN